MNNFLDYISKLKDNDPSLTELSFANKPLNEENLTLFLNSFSENKYLKILELNNNFLSLDHVHLLANILEKNHSLESLYLRSCQIGDKGAEILAGSLRYNYSLHQIYLGNNRISAAGILSFAKILQFNVGLEVLSFRNNVITTEACRALAKSLETNATLKTLNLANTELNDEAIGSFLYTLLLNTTLQEIKTNYNNIENIELLNKIKEALSYNKSQNVVAINALARKIVKYCENYVELENSGQKTQELEHEITEKYGLNREDRYHLSSKNVFGGAILCLALVFNIVESKYSSEGVDVMMRAVNHLCDLFKKVENEMQDQAIKKPNEKIIEIAQNVISTYKEKGIVN